MRRGLGREGGRAARAWLWVVVTALVVVFHIARNRSGKVARHLLGADFAGFLTTDKWSAYEWVVAGLRQLCWAHLTRDFQRFIDRGGRGGRIGRELMRERNRFFTLAAHRRGLRGPSLLPTVPVPQRALHCLNW